MPSRSGNQDTATTRTGDSSSLRNYDYVPSVQESTVPGSDNETDSECSVLSSVLSSVKRDLKKQKYQGFKSTESSSTGRPESIMWQQTESEAEFYDSFGSSDDETNESVNPKIYGKEVHKAPGREARRFGRNRISDVEERQRCCSDSPSSKGSPNAVDSLDCGIGLNQYAKAASNDSNQVKDRSYIRRPKSNDRSSGSKDSRKSKNSYKRQEKHVAKSKQLRFSAESLVAAAKSRKTEDRQTIQSYQSNKNEPTKLDYVNYDTSAIHTASDSQDLSTLCPIDKEDCKSVFLNRRVPSEVPMSESNSYELSSIHGLSTKPEYQTADNIMEAGESASDEASDGDTREKFDDGKSINKALNNVSDDSSLDLALSNESSFVSLSTDSTYSEKRRPGAPRVQEEASLDRIDDVEAKGRLHAIISRNPTERSIQYPYNDEADEEQPANVAMNSVEGPIDYPCDLEADMPETTGDSVTREQQQASSFAPYKPQTRLQKLRRRLETIRAGQSDGELFLTAIVALSVLTLVLLVIAILNL